MALMTSYSLEVRFFMSGLFDNDEEEKETPSASIEYQEGKKNGFKNLVNESFTAMQTSFDYLLKTIENNPDRIILGLIK